MARSLKKKECPKDWTPLVGEKLEVPGLNIKIDRCPKCEGMFLDKGETKRATGKAELNTFLTKHTGIDSDSPLVCPACGNVMDMEDCDGVRVDVCLTCFGVWLDQGELEALKTKENKAFVPANFTEAKRKEVLRGKEVAKADRKKAWKVFLWRLSGQDLMGKPPPK